MSSSYSRVWPPNYVWQTRLNPQFLGRQVQRVATPLTVHEEAPIVGSPPLVHPPQIASPNPLIGHGQLVSSPQVFHQQPVGFYIPWLMSLAWLSSGRQKGFREVFSWSTVDFDYPSHQARDLARAQGWYTPNANLPLGLEIAGNRMFVTLPRWKKGVPATLAWVPLDSRQKSPKLRPYPNWGWHSPGSCSGITSVFRIAKDDCGRLWVVDTGVVELVTSVKNLCPAQILVFDLHTDTLIMKYKIPKKQIPPGALFTNIAVEVMDECDDAYAYISDVFRYGLIVFSLKESRSWRVEHPFFYPDPLTSKYEIDNIKFTWNDGIFGLALSPRDLSGSRYLFFHPMSSFREFHVDTKMLKNETFAKNADDMMKVVGEERKRYKGQASGSAMDRTGILFYNLVTRSAVGCWNSQLPHYPETHGIVDENATTLNFPNDLKTDHEVDQGLWVLSNRLHKFLYDKLDPTEINFRVMTIKVGDAIKGTPCEPGYIPPPRRSRTCYGFE